MTARHLAVLGFLAFVHLALAAVVVVWGIVVRNGTGADSLLGVAFGIPYGQLGFAAIWAVMAPTRVSVRVLVSSVLGAVAIAGFVGFFGAIHFEDFVLLIVAVFGVTWILLQIPLWICRLGFGWQLQLVNGTASTDSHDELQFGIRQLLLWTTILGIVFGMARWGFAESNWGGHVFESQTLIAFVLLGGFSFLLTAPMIWATLLKAYLYVTLPLAILFVGMVTLVELPVFNLCLDKSGNPSPLFWWLMNFMHTAVLLVSLFALRFAGLRLSRRRIAERT